MVQIYKVPFAAQGDKDAIPVPAQGDGSVSVTQGFGYDYEREYEDPAAKDIRREIMNGILHDFSEALGQMQQFGFATWQAVDGGWPIGANVRHGGGIWQSLANANTEEPGTGVLWVEDQSLFKSTMPIYETTPGSNVGPIIYVIDRQQILLWQTIGTFTGYASAEVGDFRWGTSIAAKPSTEFLIGQTIDRSLAKYAALVAWAEVNGHVVDSGSWIKGAFHFSSLGGNSIRLPDLRDMFIRATGTDLDTANARLLGSFQLDGFKSHAHRERVNNTVNAQVGSTAGFYGLTGTGWAGGSNEGNANQLTSAEGGTESRSINTAMHPVIML